eukprot:scaffold9191_cov114-Isochrysis_galbana.AAC.6
MSISSYASAIIVRLVNRIRRKPSFSQPTPSRQSGMVQLVVQEMFATVHAAGSSLLGWGVDVRVREGY